MVKRKGQQSAETEGKDAETQEHHAETEGKDAETQEHHAETEGGGKTEEAQKLKK